MGLYVHASEFHLVIGWFIARYSDQQTHVSKEVLRIVMT